MVIKIDFQSEEALYMQLRNPVSYTHLTLPTT